MQKKFTILLAVIFILSLSIFSFGQVESRDEHQAENFAERYESRVLAG